MDFTFQQEITKDFLLSKYSEETIFCHYINLTQIPKKLIISPVRDDKRPTCGFYRNKTGTLILHDFATGEYLNCFSLVMKMYNCTYHQALKLIAKDFGLISSEFTPTKVVRRAPVFVDDGCTTRIQVELCDYTEQDLNWWKQFGISKKTLDKYRVFACNTVFLNGNIYAKRAQHNPIYGYYFGKKGDLEQWRIYFPQRKEMRFIGNVKSTNIQGFKQLPSSGNILVITKSMKDVMLLCELGIPAIAPMSETSFIKDNILQYLKQRFKYIVVFFDNDYAGISNMCKIKKSFPELNYVYIPRKLGSKDITDLYKDNSREFVVDKIKSYLKYLKNNGKTSQ